jgi:hypothetical protein
MSLTWGQRVTVLGGLLLVVGAPLDWIAVDTAYGRIASQTGLERGEGFVTLLLGAATAIGTWRVAADDERTWRPRVHAGVALAGFVSVLVTGMVSEEIEEANLLYGGGLETGAGLGMSALGGFLLFGTGLACIGRFYWSRRTASAQPQRPAAGEPEPGSETAERLRELRELHDEGVITDQEFEEKKRDLLDEL